MTTPLKVVLLMLIFKELGDRIAKPPSSTGGWRGR